jgi:hypothetical protein
MCPSGARRGADSNESLPKTRELRSMRAILSVMKKTTCLALTALAAILMMAACSQPSNDDDSVRSPDLISSQNTEGQFTSNPTLAPLASATPSSIDSASPIPDASDGCAAMTGVDGKPVIDPQTGQRKMQDCAYQTAPAFNSFGTTGFTLKTPTFTWNDYSYEATALIRLAKSDDLAQVACPYWNPEPPNGAYYLVVDLTVKSVGNANDAPFPTSGIELHYVPTGLEGTEAGAQPISFHPAGSPGACVSGLSGGQAISPEGTQSMIGSIPVPPNTDASKWQVELSFGGDSASNSNASPGAGTISVSLGDTRILSGG